MGRECDWESRLGLVLHLLVQLIIRLCRALWDHLQGCQREFFAGSSAGFCFCVNSAGISVVQNPEHVAWSGTGLSKLRLRA